MDNDWNETDMKYKTAPKTRRMKKGATKTPGLCIQMNVNMKKQQD